MFSTPPPDDQAIFRLGGECEDLFSRIRARLEASMQINVHSDRIQLLGELEYRFQAWAGFLGVFASEELCLDRRLRRHQDLKDLVTRYLAILRCNLQQGR